MAKPASAAIRGFYGGHLKAERLVGTEFILSASGYTDIFSSDALHAWALDIVRMTERPSDEPGRDAGGEANG
jgi:hypothetical protein